jgi:COP9 signalosome complex subunit 5
MMEQERKEESKLSKAAKDSSKITIEALHGLMNQVIKDRLFNQTGAKDMHMTT